MQSDAPIAIGFVAFPQLTVLDLTGPWEVLTRVPGARCHLTIPTLPSPAIIAQPPPISSAPFANSRTKSHATSKASMLVRRRGFRSKPASPPRAGRGAGG